MTKDKLDSTRELVEALNLCQAFMKESRYGHLPLSEKKAEFVLGTAQNRPDVFFLRYNFTESGECVGLFIGRIEELFFADSYIASDLVFYVREDHRGSPWFVKTLREFEKWAKDKGALYVKLLPNSGINTQSAPKLFERLGYDQVGHIFNKEL